MFVSLEGISGMLLQGKRSDLSDFLRNEETTASEDDKKSFPCKSRMEEMP
jgi:hypothetical protein